MYYINHVIVSKLLLIEFGDLQGKLAWSDSKSSSDTNKTSFYKKKNFPASLRNPRRNNELEEEQRANISITRTDSAKSEKKRRRTLRVVGVRNSSLEFVPANAKLRRRRRSWRGECPMFRERSTYFSDVETTRELDIDFDEERIKKETRGKRSKEEERTSKKRNIMVHSSASCGARTKGNIATRQRTS